MDQQRDALSEREGKQLRGLARRKVRQAEGRFLAEGVRVVEDLLTSSLETEWICAASSLVDSDRGAALLRTVAERQIPLRLVPDRNLQALAATEHSQGVVAVARTPRHEWDRVLAASGRSVLLLLDGVQDPGNVGTLARTAEALGASAVVTLPGTADPWNPKAVRAAAGSLFRLPVLGGDWETAAARLRAAGYRLLAAEAGGAPASGAGDRVGLVMGNEGAGLSEAVRSDVDGTVGVPIRGRAESLNVAAAAAILLHELIR